MKNIIIISLIILLITISFIATGCVSEEVNTQKEYEKCTAGCAALLTTEDYVTYHLCNEECKKRFLNST